MASIAPNPLRCVFYQTVSGDLTAGMRPFGPRSHKPWQRDQISPETSVQADQRVSIGSLTRYFF